MTRTALWAAPLGLALVLPAGAAAAGIERSFDVGPGGILRIDADATMVEIHGATSDRVDLEITRRGDDADDIEDDYDIDFAQNGDEIVVEIRRKRRFSPFRWFSSRSLELEARVPERFDVRVETSGGSVEVAELIGEVQVKTSGGGLSIEEVEGEVWGRTSGGSIRLDEISGPAEVRTSGGSIRVGDVAGEVDASTSGGSIVVDSVGGPLTVKTSGGSIEIHEAQGSVIASTSGGSIRARLAGQPAADCRLTTSGGSVTVLLDRSIAVDVDAEASGGRIHDDLGDLMSERSSSRSRLSGKVNGGGPTLLLRTSGGSVRLLEA